MRNDPYENAPRLPEGEGLEPGSLFGLSGGAKAGAGERPWVELEIGPGRGWFMVERLEADPEALVFGFEIKRKWASIVDQRLAARGYGQRARVFAEDVRLALPRIAAESLSCVYIHFPDPWWKKRHHKRMVVCDPVIEQVVRVLVPGGVLFVQTDVEERAEAFERLIGGEPGLHPARYVAAVVGGAEAVDGAAGKAVSLEKFVDAESPQITENPFQARSPRERKAIEDELPVYRLLYRKPA